ncbi:MULTISPECIES: transposase family protein [Trichocoleus]|uniref:Transposase n=1 Tax=Trichocoleus desertorum GB2-A4 TaxID=2933944 RepID=A0ABV0JG39_9CYAN|nr:transposase family protein [Trichocoleus sp. FACHB-46]MBD1865083.1 transposase [Trichocoleus sp. FACHB-46]
MKQSFFNRLLHLFNTHPQLGKRMVGLGAKALWELWQRMTEAEQAERLRQAQRPGRKRQAGGGRKKDVAVLGRLLVTLIYLRQHWTLQAIAVTLGCAEATVWNYIHEMLPQIREHLPTSLLEQWQQECPSVERAELEQCLAELPEGALLVDSWEQGIPRPTDNQEQEEYYSGKQKEHTRKNQAIVLPKGADLIDVVLGEQGLRSDSKLFEQTQDELPNHLSFIGDRAYVGRRNTTTPYKKPLKGELTQGQKEFNRYVIQKRAFVEQVIRVIKIFWIAKEEFRMRSRMYETAIGCVCGLVRLRVQYV